jgi:hypothetical protein
MNERANIASNVAAHIDYDDLREWLAHAERLGEVRTVKGASWEEDIGLAAEAILRAENGPCVVFEDVPGSPKGYRVLLNMFAGTRRNMTLGFPDHLNKWELSDAYREAYLAEPKIIPHEIVDDGPVLENVLTGDDIDVTKFPSPIWHEKDGGRYIGTGTYSITRDPEENWLNAGAYRAMVHDKNSVGIVTARGHHGFIHRWRSSTVVSRRHTAHSSSTSSAACAGARPKWCAARSPACHFPPTPRSCSKASSRPTSAATRVRSANGPGTMPAGFARCRCSTSRRSITATIRSWSACRRWARGRTRWRATAP